jgi:hypothetical protein
MAADAGKLFAALDVELGVTAVEVALHSAY